jgi:hypothetical protein
MGDVLLKVHNQEKSNLTEGEALIEETFLASYSTPNL